MQRAFAAVAFAVIWQATCAQSGTAGCGNKPPYVMNWITHVAEASMSFTDPDPRLGTVERKYAVHLPPNYDPSSPMPLAIYLHGQCVTWNDVLHYGAYGDYYLPNAITLIPSGVDEGICIQWNVGSGGNDQVCDPKRHFPSKYATNFSSCMKTNATSICNCYGCYDDPLYVSQVYEKVAKELCIDSDRMFAYGVSNGGMFTYRVAAAFAKSGKPLRGFVPWYGGILQHVDAELESLAGTSLLAIHGTQDIEIPLKGGESIDGYLYRSVDDIQKTLGGYSKCGPMEQVDVPFSDTTLVGCYVAQKCSHSPHGAATQRVSCIFTQGHGFWLGCAVAMMDWFFNLTEAQALVV